VLGEAFLARRELANHFELEGGGELAWHLPSFVGFLKKRGHACPVSGGHSTGAYWV
jgi:hypothetical protein